MVNISSVRLAAPKESAGNIFRQELIDAVLGSPKKLIYIQAGAGYGKTTLLSQIANSKENTVWLTLDGESDVFTFVNILSEAIRLPFLSYNFAASEYLPFEGKDNFITILANALISSIEKLAEDISIIFDDLHTIEDLQIRKLLTCIMKYAPENIRLCLSSREAPWQELVPLRVRGNILELTQKELAFTRDEVSQILGFADENIYGVTEGWPLAIGSFKVLLENGVSLVDIPAVGIDVLYSYLFYECISRLPSEMVDFLKATACLEDLDPPMLDAVLSKKNTRLMLESLVARNIFTIKTVGGQYRYHSLFREYLLADADVPEKYILLRKGLLHYFEIRDYSKAAKYAILSENKEMLEQVILVSYKDYLKNGSFSELRMWFQTLGDTNSVFSPEILVAKGAFYQASVISLVLKYAWIQ